MGSPSRVTAYWHVPQLCGLHSDLPPDNGVITAFTQVGFLGNGQQHSNPPWHPVPTQQAWVAWACSVARPGQGEWSAANAGTLSNATINARIFMAAP